MGLPSPNTFFISPSRLPFSQCFTYQTPVFPGSLLQPGYNNFFLSGPQWTSYQSTAGLQLFSQLGYRHPPDSRFPIDSPIRLPFSLDPYFSWVTNFCSAGLQLFAQHT